MLFVNLIKVFVFTTDPQLLAGMPVLLGSCSSSVCECVRVCVSWGI